MIGIFYFHNQQVRLIWCIIGVKFINIERKKLEILFYLKEMSKLGPQNLSRTKSISKVSITSRSKKEPQLTPTIINLSHLFNVMSAHENYLQSIRQALISQPDFNPKNLFYYISDGEEQITKKDIFDFMQRSEQELQESQIKIILSMNGLKEKMNYRSYLHFLYPYHKSALGKINIRSYDKSEGKPVTEQICCLFMMLIKGQSTYMYEFEEAKKDLFPDMTKDKIKCFISEIKQIGNQKKDIKSDYVITHKEFQNCLKMTKIASEANKQLVCRRFSQCQQVNFVTLQQLVFWFRSWDKILNGLSIYSGNTTKSALQRVIVNETANSSQANELSLQ